MRQSAHFDMYFDLKHFQSGSLLPLANFLAEQLGIAVQSAAVKTSNATLKKYMAGLRDEIQEHKFLEWARGVIEWRRLIPA